MSTQKVLSAIAASNKAAGIKFDGPLLWKVTYKRCAVHTSPKVRATADALGLRKLNHSIIVKNVRPVRGMLNVLKHYITLEPYHYDPKNVPLVYPVK